MTTIPPALLTLLKEKGKAIGAALLTGVGGYVVAYFVQGQQFTLHGLEGAVAIAIFAGLGVHQLPANALTARQRAALRAAPILPLGKAPARKDARDLPMVQYLTSTLPPVPTGIVGRFMSLIGVNAWGMLGNATAGDCVWAGADHETMGWNAEADTTVVFTDATAISDYSADTGYNPAVPSTDKGTDVRQAYSYRSTTGVVDAAGKRHKLGAYLSVDRNAQALILAIYLFGAVGLGIEFPASAMDQFNAGQPWDVVKGAKIEGGHYIPLVGYNPATGLWYVITWGKLQAMTTAFLMKYADEHYALLSEEMLKNGISADGFDDAALRADLAAINAVPVKPAPPAPTPVPDGASIVITDPDLVTHLTALATKAGESGQAFTEA